jgi:nuclear transport factor 2 (NTF2) superfamily protein
MSILAVMHPQLRRLVMTDQRPPFPPFDEASALKKVLGAEAAWNSRDPDKVAGAYSQESEWRNRDTFLRGREELRDFLSQKWSKELDYALRKDLWAFHGNRIAVRFQYESLDSSGQWWRSYGNENWEFDEYGLMRRREASINDVAIDAADKRLFGPRDVGDDSGIPLR